MQSTINFLRGKKTYLLATGGAGTTLLYMLGFIDYQVFEILMGLFGFTSIATLRAGIK